MKDFIKFGSIIFATIILTGVALDEMAKGTFGKVTQDLAQKATRGYGV